jgi:plastocyanin
MKGKFSLIFVVTLFFILSIGLTSSADQSQAKVEITSFSFQPASIVVSAGTNVTWINRDPVIHTVAADDGSFRSPDIDGNGGKFEHTFEIPGNYSYYCTIHPFMKGVVVITGAQSESILHLRAYK